MRGVMGEMDNVTVGPQCRFVLENSTETGFALDHVVVQTDGYMAAVREDRKDVQMIGKTFDIRGGATVSSIPFLKFNRVFHGGHVGGAKQYSLFPKGKSFYCFAPPILPPCTKFDV